MSSSTGVSGLILLGFIAAFSSRPSHAQPSVQPRQNAPAQAASTGKVVDGQGRPFEDVTLWFRNRASDVERLEFVTDEEGLLVQRKDDGSEVRQDFTVVSAADGTCTARLAGKPDEYEVEVKTKDKENIHSPFCEIDAKRNVIILTMRLNWDTVFDLQFEEGKKLEQGLREVLTSEDPPPDRERFDRFVFEHQDCFLPVLRRLAHDTQVGGDARHWLDFLGDPDDVKLLPKGRKYLPKDEVRETDFVAAFQTAARHRNYFSSAPEPDISLDFIEFNESLNAAFVQCGINMAPFTGIKWRFVFHKVGDKWVLRTAQEYGRG